MSPKPSPKAPNGTNSSRLSPRDDPDFHPTPPWAGRAVCEIIARLDPGARSAWECAAGAHHLAHGLRERFATVHTSDAYDFGIGDTLYDFTSDAPPPFEADWIVTNPPFGDNIAAFMRLAHARARRGVALLLRLACLEGIERYGLLYEELPYLAVAPFSERLPILKHFYDPDASSAAVYAWFIWRVGIRPAPGQQRVMPIPPGTEARLTRPSDAAFAVGAVEADASGARMEAAA